MDVWADQKEISSAERTQINKQVKLDLIDHLYKGCLPGTIAGIAISFVFFLFYYGHTSTYLLIAWLSFFNLMMISLTALFVLYINFKPKLKLPTWEMAYSIMMIGCAIAWVPSIFLLPVDSNRQYLALFALFLATTGYATGTIGQFKLCVLTLIIMLLPLVVWSFYLGGIFYNVIGIYSIVYFCFMISINFRSTRWFIDSLKLKLENSLVTYQANHDLLTNLPNQRLLPQYLKSAIKSAENKYTFALVCFSIDRMEMIDDSLGHQASNAVIRALAERLNALLEEAENSNESTKYIITLSRKETFNILMLPLKLEEADQKIKLIFSVLDEPFYLEKKAVKMSASIGVSFYPNDGEDAETLIINADAAMLLAKQVGGNHLEYYRPEINAQLPRELELEADLHNAIKKNQLQVYYQPLVNLKTGKIIGSEALLRWIHPVHGFISPANFIPLAEESGLIVTIGAWVMEEACKQTRIWQKSGFQELTVSVNIAERQLRQKDFIEDIKRILQKTDFDPRLLELELTETAILDETVMGIIKEFKMMGLSLAVDDFGTGYSGLSYLKRFSINKLKIDQSFIRDIPTNYDSMTIVSAILAMAKELGINSLAEGVETEAQLQFLKNKECDYIQGYYFSKPIPHDSFTKLLVSQSKKIEEESVK
jgi:diguanylate cyclase (GGDEF)-like protein